MNMLASLNLTLHGHSLPVATGVSHSMQPVLEWDRFE
jgi:hypothetical protein